MIKRRRILKSFLKMVRIDSPSKHERRMADHVVSELKKLGLKPREDAAHRRFGGEAGNIHAVIRGGSSAAPRLLLNAHLDTVAPGVGIRPRVKGRYVVTDGRTILGADNKAGVAVMLEVARTLREEKVFHGDIVLLFTVSEEIGLVGAKNMKRGGLKADLGLTLDGGDVDEIIYRAPSQDNIRVEITGRAAHAGVRPEEGVSAIRVASIAVSRMRLGRIDKETTANIGIIKGGVARNIVPEKVVLIGEARSHSASKLRAQVAHMKREFVRSCRANGARMEFEVTRSYDAFAVPSGSPAYRIVMDSANAIGLSPKAKITGGGSDANVFNARGVPTLIIGAGADRVHTSTERLSIDQMCRSAELVTQVIKEVSLAKK